MYCLECGKKIFDNSRFCSFCGAKQNTSQAPSEEHIVKDKVKKDSVVENKWDFDFILFKKYLPWIIGWVLIHLSILLIWAYSILPDGYRNDDFPIYR